MAEDQTDSLLSASAQKRDQDAEALAKQTSGGTDSNTPPASTPAKAKPSTLPKPPGAAKIGAIGQAIGSFKKGGTVPETGMYKLHKGEEVIPAGRASEYRKVYLSRKNKK